MCEGAGPWVILTRINIRHCKQSHDVQLAGPRLVSSLAKMKHTGHFEAYLQCSLLASSSRGPMTDESHTCASYHRKPRWPVPKHPATAKAWLAFQSPAGGVTVSGPCTRH